MKYSETFKEKTVKKVLEKKLTHSMVQIAKELNISKATLYKWVKNNKSSTSSSTLELSEKLQILKESYAMSEEALNGYCREKGIFTHQLQEWERDFLKKKKIVTTDTSKHALEEEKQRSKALAKELRRKEKALAETAALLVLQKKFQALLEDEEL